MTIKFSFNQRKAIQAAALLLQLHGGNMRRLRLIKLLYLAERESLKQFGKPIIGDDYVSMPHGPVLSKVLNLAKEDQKRIDGSLWQKYIRKSGENSVKLVLEPKYSKLSPAEVKTLKQVHHTHRNRTRWEIRDMTHLFEEWENPGESSIPIEVESILKAVKKSDSEIDHIAKAAIESQYFTRLFNSRA